MKNIENLRSMPKQRHNSTLNVAFADDTKFVEPKLNPNQSTNLEIANI